MGGPALTCRLRRLSDGPGRVLYAHLLERLHIATSNGGMLQVGPGSHANGSLYCVGIWHYTWRGHTLWRIVDAKS
jgi:hypothetical protein